MTGRMPTTAGGAAKNVVGQQMWHSTTTPPCTLCYTLRCEGSEYASSCCEGARCAPAAWLALLLGRRMPASATRHDRFRRMLSCTFISCSNKRSRPTENCKHASHWKLRCNSSQCTDTPRVALQIAVRQAPTRTPPTHTLLSPAHT